jgi:hypothetical protein
VEQASVLPNVIVYGQLRFITPLDAATAFRTAISVHSQVVSALRATPYTPTIPLPTCPQFVANPADGGDNQYDYNGHGMSVTRTRQKHATKKKPPPMTFAFIGVGSKGCCRI